MDQKQGEEIRVRVTAKMYKELKVIKTNTDKSFSTLAKMILRRIESNYQDIINPK